MPTRRGARCAFCAVALFCMWAGVRAQIDRLPEGASLQDVVAAGNAIFRPGNATSAEEPIRGSVGLGEVEAFALLVVKKKAWPDVFVALEFVDRHGSVDVYCLPEGHLFSGDAVGNGVQNKATWQAENSKGNNALFISRKDADYDAAKTNSTSDGNKLDIAIFACAVAGSSTSGTSYEVRVEIDYHQRSLVAKEQKIVKSIFDRCCGGTSQCGRWGKDVTKKRTLKEFCYLEGIMCDVKGHLTRLDLSNNELVCDVPVDDLRQLGSLQVLQMSSNSLTGNISRILSTLSSISGIRHLDFSVNFLSGSISDPDTNGQPPACNLVIDQLVWLNLDSNRIEGDVPGCLFKGESLLRGLRMGNNVLKGPVPEIPNQAFIQELSLSHGNLSGTIPPSIGMVSHLKSLDLGYNALTGPIPASLASLAGLYNLQLSNNNLDGKVPDELGTSPLLRFLDINSNSLSGLPSHWMSYGLNSSGLVLLDASRNQFSGGFPMAITRAPNLIMFNVQENQFIGQLPAEEGMMKQMAVLLLGDNRFEGTIPKQLGEMGMFTEADSGLPIIPRLDLSNNLLEGSLPEFLFAENVPDELQRHISLGGNSFECTNPRGVAYLQGLNCTSVLASEEAGTTEEIDEEGGSKHKSVAIVVVVGVGGFLVVGFVAIGAFIIMWRRTKWRESPDAKGDSFSEGYPDGGDNEPDFNKYYHP